MILDKQALFTDGLSIISTANSSILDLGSADAGKGNPVAVFCQVVEDYAGGNSVTVALETSDAEDMSGAATLVAAGPVATSALKAGYRFALGCLPANAKRYARLAFVVDGAVSAGRITAGLALDVQS